MTRGFQPDPIKEYAANMGIARTVALWSKYEQETKTLAARALAEGCRADVIAKQLDMSRATLYRWLRSTDSN